MRGHPDRGKLAAHAQLLVNETVMALTIAAQHGEESQSLPTALRRAKFEIPLAPRRAIVRPQLVDPFCALDDATRATVTIVSAASGAGKTATVAAAARAFGRAAWCRLDEDD